MKKNCLIISIAFFPNLGGVETHLLDLTSFLVKNGWKIIVLTYQPLQTPALGKWFEKSYHLSILRLPVIRGLFYKFLERPVLEFLFLAPLQFIFVPIILFLDPDIYVINSQGIISGFSGTFWSKVFKKRHVIATQSVYKFPKKGFYRLIAKWIFESSDMVLAISKQSAKGIEELGIDAKKIQVFTHWEDIKSFKPQDKQKAKQKVGLTEKFVVSFFGRLVEEKGVKVLLDAIRITDPKIVFAIYGEGPLKKVVEAFDKKYSNLKYMGIISPKDLPLHYSAAEVVIMPSLHEEGFGRVAAGALLCGIPVVASNRGALPEVINSSVGEIIEPKPRNIALALEDLFEHPNKLKIKSDNARLYAVKRFSDKNAKIIEHTFIG